MIACSQFKDLTPEKKLSLHELTALHPFSQKLHENEVDGLEIRRLTDSENLRVGSLVSFVVFSFVGL